MSISLSGFDFIIRQFEHLLSEIDPVWFKTPNSDCYDNLVRFLTDLSKQERNCIWNFYQPQREGTSFLFSNKQNLIFDRSYNKPEILNIVRHFGYHIEVFPFHLVVSYQEKVDYLRTIRGFFPNFGVCNNELLGTILRHCNGNVDIVDFIIELGCISRINYSETNQHPIMEIVCNEGTIDIFQRIIDAGYEFNREDNAEMQKCYEIICQKDRDDFFNVLFAHGFDAKKYQETLDPLFFPSYFELR